jgi:hypothetical protein
MLYKKVPIIGHLGCYTEHVKKRAKEKTIAERKGGCGYVRIQVYVFEKETSERDRIIYSLAKTGQGF